MTLLYISVRYVRNITYFLYTAGKLCRVLCDCVHEGLHDKGAKNEMFLCGQTAGPASNCCGVLVQLVAVSENR